MVWWSMGINQVFKKFNQIRKNVKNVFSKRLKRFPLQSFLFYFCSLGGSSRRHFGGQKFSRGAVIKETFWRESDKRGVAGSNVLQKIVTELSFVRNKKNIFIRFHHRHLTADLRLNWSLLSNWYDWGVGSSRLGSDTPPSIKVILLLTDTSCFYPKVKSCSYIIAETVI